MSAMKITALFCVLFCYLIPHKALFMYNSGSGRGISGEERSARGGRGFSRRGADIDV